MATFRGSILLIVGGLSLSLAPACAPTLELRDARTAYDTASGGKAAERVPWRVEEAKRALGAAERARELRPGSQREADLGYIAHRKALRATAEAETALTRERIALAKAGGETVLVSEDDAEDIEHLARLFAQRGPTRMIMIPGQLLFRSDEADLLPVAKQQLDAVAAALRRGGEARVTIEGHADARGSEEHNLALSQRRAMAVRDYLASKGVPLDRLTVVGSGESRPLADNASAEGRAVNRRVELEVRTGDEGARDPGHSGE